MTRVAFQHQLDAVESELVAIASQVTDLIIPVTAALLSADERALAEIFDQDAGLDQRCALLEERCFELLARPSPVAGDLRRVVAALRCTADVQRSRDLLRHVAEALAWVYPPSMRPRLRELIAGLGTVSERVFGGAVSAWREHDALAAVELQRLDDEADLLQKTMLRELYAGGQSVEEAVSLALICRYYERIADHGVEIARQLAYVLTGDRPPTE